MNTNITLCMIVKNEQNFIGSCLDSIYKICDRILIADTGSIDQTIKIASQYTNEIERLEFVDDYSIVRNDLIKRVETPWILFLDADEYFLKRDIHKIVEMVKNAPQDVFAYNFYRYNFFNTGGWNTSKLTIRLFRNNEKIFYKGKVIESVVNSVYESGGKLERAPIVLNHYGPSRSYNIREEKYKYYLSLLHKEIQERPDDYLLYGYVALNLRNLGHFSEALTRIESVLKMPMESYRESSIALLYSFYGQILRSIGKNNEALEAYKLAMSIQNDPLYLNMIGLIQLSLKKYEQTTESLNMALNLDPLLSHIYINKGLTEQAQGNYSKALKYYYQAAKENPGFMHFESQNTFEYDPFKNFQYETVFGYNGLQSNIDFCRNYIKKRNIYEKQDN